MIQVKICGLTRPEDIRAVNQARPDYAGFVVEVPTSRRSVTVQQLRQLAAGLEKGIQPVGVFVDAPVEQVADLLNDGTIAVAQLHGAEDAAYLSALRAHTQGAIWQAFRVRTREDLWGAQRSSADMILLDAGAGSGKVFDWDWLDGIHRPFVLAGGLCEQNIPQAMETGAICLDLSSGAETAGTKDAAKIARIVSKIKGGI